MDLLHAFRIEQRQGAMCVDNLTPRELLNAPIGFC